MSAVDTVIADLKAQKYSGRAQLVIVITDDLIAAINQLAGGSGPAGGDLSGTYPNPTVAGIQGVPVSNTPPLNGQTLTFNAGTWAPG